MRKHLFLTLLFSFAFLLKGSAQNTDGSLAVAQYESVNTIPKLLAELSGSPDDKDKVDLLIKVSSIYQRRRTDMGQDSCLVYAKQGLSLSRKIRYTNGSNESLFLQCKAYTSKNNPEAAISLSSSAFGEERVRLLLVISEYYTFLPGGEKSNLAKGYPYLLEATKLSDSVKSRYWLYQSLVLSSKFNFIGGNFEGGKAAMMRIIIDCQKSNAINDEAHYWSELGLYMPETESTYQEKIKCHQMAVNLYLKANNKKEAAYSLRDIASLNEDHDNPILAEKQMRSVVELLNQVNEKLTFNTLKLLSQITFRNGRVNEALKYIIQGYDMCSPEDGLKKAVCYAMLGEIYSSLNQGEKSLHFYQLELNYTVETQNSIRFQNMTDVCLLTTQVGRPKVAMDSLIGFLKTNKPVLTSDQMLINLAFGYIYNALGDFKKAETYYRSSLALEKQLLADRKKEVFRDQLNRFSFYKIIGQFFADRKSVQDGKPLLNKALGAGMDKLNTISKEDIEYSLFRIDSAAGNFKSALFHHVRHDALKDSMFNLKKTREIEEIAVKYDTRQNQEKIKLLNSQALYSGVKIQKISFQRNVTIGMVVLVLAFAGLVFNSFKRKQQTNLLLQKKQVEINGQNIALQSLVTEKEWLLKEVHHRVKNNLQIMISLLSLQSVNLKNDFAQEAIKNSSRRIYSMSLIHQKLYQSENMNAINMKLYISELVKYLKESFGVDDQIKFLTDLEELELDVLQSVPLGLLLNEIITNAIKHAFPENRKGFIKIDLFEGSDSFCNLKIEDNGIGLPPSLESAQDSSLGFRLINGLTEQLQGKICIERVSGTKISITFPPILKDPD